MSLDDYERFVDDDIGSSASLPVHTLVDVDIFLMNIH